MAQWVKDTEAAGVAAGTRIPSLAQEFTHALGMVKKKKKKREEFLTQVLLLTWILGIWASFFQGHFLQRMGRKVRRRIQFTHLYEHI